MRPPARNLLGDRSGDLGVEVEAEVVTGGEVREPLITNPDPAAVDLVDDRIRHRVRAAQVGEIRDARKPALDPGRAIRGRTESGTPWGRRCHGRLIGRRGDGPYPDEGTYSAASRTEQSQSTHAL